MKRTQLIEAGILIVGLIFGYKFVEGFVSLSLQIIFSYRYDFDLWMLLPSIVMMAIYAGFLFLIINKSNQIANYLDRNGTKELYPIKINKGALLHIILIALCLATILSNIADIIVYLFMSFKDEIDSQTLFKDGPTVVSKHAFILAAVQTVTAFIVIYFSRTISNWFFANNPVEELIFDSTIKNNSENV